MTLYCRWLPEEDDGLHFRDTDIPSGSTFLQGKYKKNWSKQFNFAQYKLACICFLITYGQISQYLEYFKEKKKTSRFLSHFYHFHPICSSLMSFPWCLVLFTLLQTAFQNTLSVSSFLIPTFTVTNPPHLAQAEYCLTHSWAPGKHPLFLSFCTTSLAVTACQSFKSEMTEATLNSTLNWRHVEKPRLLSSGSMLLRVSLVDEGSCTLIKAPLKPEVSPVKVTAQEYTHQHSTGGPKSHKTQYKRNY